MLIKKLPTNPSPPKMSIHWSIPWPMEEWAEKQVEKRYSKKGVLLKGWGGKLTDQFFIPDAFPFGLEPRANKARKIKYKDEYIRVFAHEFSELKPENLQTYINETHELVPGSVAEQEFINDTLKGKKKILYQSARIMGCDHYKAMLVVMGIDIFSGDYEVPPIGWYRIKPEFGNYFCYKEELTE